MLIGPPIREGGEVPSALGGLVERGGEVLVMLPVGGKPPSERPNRRRLTSAVDSLVGRCCGGGGDSGGSALSSILTLRSSCSNGEVSSPSAFDGRLYAEKPFCRSSGDCVLPSVVPFLEAAGVLLQCRPLARPSRSDLRMVVLGMKMDDVEEEEGELLAMVGDASGMA